MLAVDIRKALAGCALPLAYRQFPESEAPSLPYVVWYIGGEGNFSADGRNYYNIKQLTVELYTRQKDLVSEQRVEDVLNTLGIWGKTEVYIDTEKCFQITYDLEV